MPLVGFLTLAIMLVTLVAHRPFPGRIPGALALVVVGTLAYYLFRVAGNAFDLNLVSGLESMPMSGELPAMPGEVWQLAWWERVLTSALEKLPLVVPFALATIVGGIDCTESAAVAGDEYDTRTILLTEGVASVIAGLAGGVIQSTPYIGHPAYKAMGGRAAYTIATALFIGLVGWFGWFSLFFDYVPYAVVYPILIFVGLEITAQSFRATPSQHYPALAFAVLPVLAYLVLIHINPVLGSMPQGTHLPKPLEESVQTFRCLGNGFIVTSLLWGSILAALLDGHYRRSACYLAIAAGLSLVGVIHSPLASERIAWPWQVMANLPETAIYQTPYHWAAGYLAAAGFMLIMWLTDVRREPDGPGERLIQNDTAPADATKGSGLGHA
jgi:AGZA family xanthine/uracil permease-like MFS transporter